MSYLSPLRLHFAGKFLAAISTVNNSPAHFNNNTFKKEFQERGPEGSFNPRGSADWRLIGCNVKAAWLADGSPAGNDDAILTSLVADADNRVAAKLVDLDPQQQAVSEIWGLGVRICDADGTTLLGSQYEPAAFMEMWGRAANTDSDNGRSAMYQSVLSSLMWGDLEHSPFLQQLRDLATDDLLSIKFNVDGINMDPASAEFLRGRIVGTIGVARADEPHHFVLGRQLATAGSPVGPSPAGTGRFNACIAVVNQELGKIYLDLGNAMPAAAPAGPPTDIGTLTLICAIPQGSAFGAMRIDDILYKEAGWYERTAGVVEVPANRRLTSQELETCSQNPLALGVTPAGGNPAFALSEHISGLFVRADQFVFRLNPSETAEAQLYATRWGQRLPAARLLSYFDANGLQGPAAGPLAVATPPSALKFPCLVVTDVNGLAKLPLSPKDPGNPRGFIDGQVYGVRTAIEETLAVGSNYPFNRWHFISVLVWDAFQSDEPPTWFGTLKGSMEPIFHQYANLYPAMQQFMDMADYESVCANRKLLLLAFRLDSSNPNSMPVTRDLSKSKRQAILRWLTEIGADGKPLMGTPPPPALVVEGAEAGLTVAEPAASEADLQQMFEGGKTEAMRRRLGAQRPSDETITY